MSANIIVAIVAGALFFIVVVHMVGRTGRTGAASTNQLPYDTGSSIAPPVWNADSSSTFAICDVSDPGSGDSDDSGSCDGGSDGGSGGD